MAEFASKQNVTVAAQRTRVPFNLSHKTITTQDISLLTPISVKELVPGDEFTVKVNSFTRLAPLPCPTYGDMKLVNRAFFVPYRTIFLNWKEFIDNTPATNFAGLTSKAFIPTITIHSIFQALTTIDNGWMYIVSSSDRYDFKSGSNYLAFTYQGKRVYQLLVSLGYQVWNAPSSFKVSLLPLLAYAKVYYDWYLPSPFIQSYYYTRYFVNSGSFAITSMQDAHDFLNNLPLYEPLEKDLFTTAFLEPFGNPSSQNSFTISSYTYGLDTANTSNIVFSRESNLPTEIRAQDEHALFSLTQYGLDTLKAVDQFVKRNQIAGNRYNEQTLARYGVHVSDAVANRSEYLGYTEQRISIGEVMSTADTSSAAEPSNLGDYAGRGVGTNFSTFRCESGEDFGLLIVLSCIQVKTGYPYGLKRELVMHTQREDFFTPEYDALGNQPISKGEVFCRIPDITAPVVDDPTKIFGWSPRYSEYKCSVDNLHGDFLISEYNEGMNCWHLFREIDDMTNLQPDLAFLNGDPNSYYNDFDRIFTVNAGQDHFIGVYDVNIKAYRKMKSLSDSLVTEGEGEEVSVGYNGTNF